MSRGKFITFEGGEGTGKSTQLRLLADFLRSKDIDVHTTREPGGSPGAELIRELLVTGDVERWDAITEILLFNAARRDHLTSLIFPALESGTWVICDRFADSTIAFQGYGHGVPLDQLHSLYKFIAGDVKPDLTFVFDLDPEVGLPRARARQDSECRFEHMQFDFHQRLREGYLEIAKADPDRYEVIDASLPIDEVSKLTSEKVCKHFGIEQ